MLDEASEIQPGCFTAARPIVTDSCDYLSKKLNSALLCDTRET